MRCGIMEAILVPLRNNDAERLRGVYANLHATNPDFQGNNWLLNDLPLLARTGAGTVLEVGCGNGLFAMAASRIFARVVAIDWVESPVLPTQRMPNNLTHIVGDLVEIALPQADLAVSADVFEHLATDTLSAVVSKISDAAPMQFHKIACYPDSRGLHLSVLPAEEWLGLFQEADVAFRLVRREIRRSRVDQEVICIARGLRDDML